MALTKEQAAAFDALEADAEAVFGSIREDCAPEQPRHDRGAD